MSSPVDIALTVNGRARTARVEPRKTLADVLRQDLGLTGTHLGCEHGVCGACTVLVDGAAARSCLLLAVQVDGATVTTVEGLADDGRMNPLQQAMVDAHGFQCGFCTPGFLMQLTELLADNPTPTEVEVRQALSGNICRCTGYQSIVDGALRAAGVQPATGDGTATGAGSPTGDGGGDRVTSGSAAGEDQLPGGGASERTGT